MVWATASYWSCFCSLYRASPCLAAKNIINLISVLTIWRCPCIESSLVLLEEGVCYDQCIFLAKSSLNIHWKGWSEVEALILWLPDAKSEFIEKAPMLGKIEGKRRRGWQRMWWLGCITSSMDMSFSKLREIVKDREASCATVHGDSKSHTRLSKRTTTIEKWQKVVEQNTEYAVK